MVRITWQTWQPPAAQQQHQSEDAAWGKAVLDALASLTANPDAVFATVTAQRDHYWWITMPMIDCLAFHEPVGRALAVLLRNGLLFERLLVSL
jgi:hypothetical protein